MLACLTLLNEPADWIQSVEEQLVVQRTELYRFVRMKLTIPDRDMSAAQILPSSDENTPNLACIPVVTPRKNRLVDISGLERKDGNGIYLASHAEHETLSKAMLMARLVQTYLQFLDPADPVTVRFLRSTYGRILRFAYSPDPDGERENPLFDRDGRLTLIDTGQVRPTDEVRFKKLSELLRERYMKLIITEATPGDSLQISYCYRQHYFEHRHRRIDRAKDLLATTPSSFRFQVPLARRTEHYSFRFEAPANHFIYDRYFAVKQAPGEGGQAVVQPIHASSGVTRSGPTISVEEGAGTVAHMLMTRGRTVKDGYIDAHVSVFELPPGTAAFAFMATLFVLFVAFGIKQAVEVTEIGSSDVPAVLVALVSTAPVVASPFLPRTELYATPLLTRLSLLATSCLGYLFALWLLVTTGPTEKPRHNWFISNDVMDERYDVAVWFAAHGGDVLLVALTCLCIGLARRFLGLTKRFHDITKDGLS